MKINDMENDGDLLNAKNKSKKKKDLKQEDRIITLYKNSGMCCDPRDPNVWSNTDELDWEEWDNIQENK